MPKSSKILVISKGYQWQRRLRAAALVLGLGSIAVLFDYLYGELSGISQIRQEARAFKAEAATLRLSTRSLIPDLQHVYPEPYRPEGEAFLSPQSPRRFATTTQGSVSSGAAPLDGARRILFLGGSTTECNEVDEAYRFPTVVERVLRERGAAVNVINAGIRGHTTQDAINTVVNRPEFARADTIVLMENINDRLRLALRKGYGADASGAPPTSFAAVTSAASATVRNAWEYLAYRSNVLFLARSLPERFGGGVQTAGGWVTERTLDELPPPTANDEALYAQNLRLFVAIVRTLGKTPILMTQALGKQSPGQAAFNEVIRAVARETNTQLIDLDALLPSDRGWAYLGDDIHLSNRGSLAVGQAIAASLAPLHGTSYNRPPFDTGLTALQALADACPAPSSAEVATPLRLFQIVGDSGRYPSVSRDRRWLVFQARPSSLDRIRLLRLSDHKLFELSPVAAAVHERHPAFLETTADTATIVFGHGRVGEHGGHERLMVRSWPSGATTPLYDDPNLSGSIPTVVGSFVYFAGSKDRDGSRAPNLYRFDRKERRIERLTTSTVEEWRPFASTSGDLYYIRDEGRRFAIYRRDVTGRQERIIASSGSEWDPAVSPDGKWLAFASKRHGTWDLFVAPTADPRAQRRLTSLPGDEWDPAWHPNGRTLLFGSAQGQEPKIMALCPFGDPGVVQ